MKMNDNELNQVTGGLVNRGGGREKEAQFKPNVRVKYQCPKCKQGKDLIIRSEDELHYYLYCGACKIDFTVDK